MQFNPESRPSCILLRRVLPTLAFALLAISYGSAQSAPVSLRFDYSAAAAMLQALEHPSPTEADVDRALAASGTRAVIAKAASFQPKATTDRFRHDLRNASNLGSGGDIFRLGKLYHDVPDQKQLLQQIQDHEAELGHRVAARLVEFIPHGTSLRVTVIFVEGGSSDGWTTDDSSSFFVDLDYFKPGDTGGLALLLSHELFHVLQGQVQPFAARLDDPAAGSPSATTRRCLEMESLLLDLMNEGTASYVEDSLEPGGGPYINANREKFQRNMSRLPQNFLLLHLALHSLLSEPEAKASSIYPLLFGGGWDSPAYFVGYAMAKQIDAREGRGRLLQLLVQPASQFYLDYANLSKQHAGDSDLVAVPAADAKEVQTVRADCSALLRGTSSPATTQAR